MTTLYIVVIAALALTGVYWLSSIRSRETEDPEIMRIRATHTPQLHAAYVKHKAELLDIIKEPLVVDTEESLFSESIVWRQQFRANPTAENEEKCKSHFALLQQLHKDLELNHPELAELHERIGNVREALFILEHGTAGEVRKLMTDVRTLEGSNP
jgi:hypothetical protein